VRRKTYFEMKGGGKFAYKKNMLTFAP
jgi:hypothetical protein